VNVNKSTRYALYAAMEMAAAGDEAQVTAAQVAERYRIPASVLAKVFQQLVHAGIAVGTRGTGGGYQLTAKPSQLTMLDIIQVFEPRRPPGECLLADSNDLPCPDANECRVRMVFDEVDELVRCTFASITLETLVSKRTPLDLEARGSLHRG
jgi:Rrf2 family protein